MRLLVEGTHLSGHVHTVQASSTGFWREVDKYGSRAEMTTGPGPGQCDLRILSSETGAESFKSIGNVSRAVYCRGCSGIFGLTDRAGRDPLPELRFERTVAHLPSACQGIPVMSVGLEPCGANTLGSSAVAGPRLIQSRVAAIQANCNIRSDDNGDVRRPNVSDLPSRRQHPLRQQLRSCR